jgi:hypothetical protein
MIILVAGPALSPSAFHCAGIGHWAFADDARVNAEPWAAAAAGKSGYRHLDIEPVSSPICARGGELARGIGDQSRAAALIASIPADLSIPDFLRRAVS